MLLEIAIDSLSDALSAAEAGADRLEVCDRLDLGGLTPPMELVHALASRTEVPLFVMIRPRAGDFIYASDELRLMERQMEGAAKSGAHGFVFGLLTKEATMDLDRTRELVRRAGSLPVTVHRAFDRCEDLLSTASNLADLGVERILTSGGKASAEEGADVLRDLHQKMGQRIGILPGGGVRPSNIRRLLDHIGAEEIHSAARNERGVFDPRLVEKMKREVRRVSSEQ
jgi:copper homeostasis protein